MQSRIFNKVSVDYQKRYFVKASTNIPKLKNEINYYLNLPKKVSGRFPRMLRHKKDYTEYTLEYIPYKNISELILENKISSNEGEDVLKNLFAILEELHHFKAPSKISISYIANFYITKTINRIKELKKILYFENLMGFSHIYINNKRYKNFSQIEEKFSSLIQVLISKKPSNSIIHGDFCFSNILYCPISHDIKLIDPRGSFGIEGIYGHSYYDYAKLLHCMHGKYDYIVNNQYEFHEINPNEFILKLPSSLLLEQLYRYFLKTLKISGLNLKLLYLIEASLFLSMSTLHYENIERQKVLYLNGLVILNDIIENNYENLY